MGLALKRNFFECPKRLAFFCGPRKRRKDRAGRRANDESRPNPGAGHISRCAVHQASSQGDRTASRKLKIGRFCLLGVASVRYKFCRTYFFALVEIAHASVWHQQLDKNAVRARQPGNCGRLFAIVAPIAIAQSASLGRLRIWLLELGTW